MHICSWSGKAVGEILTAEEGPWKGSRGTMKIKQRFRSLKVELWMKNYCLPYQQTKDAVAIKPSATPSSVPWGDSGWKRAGYRPQIAEAHIKGTVSVSPRSCIFHIYACYVPSVLSDSDPMDPMEEPTRLLRLWNSPGKNTGGGCHALLQGIFLIQGSNPGLLHCSQILYHLSHQVKQLSSN